MPAYNISHQQGKGLMQQDDCLEKLEFNTEQRKDLPVPW